MSRSSRSFKERGAGRQVFDRVRTRESEGGICRIGRRASWHFPDSLVTSDLCGRPAPGAISNPSFVRRARVERQVVRLHQSSGR